MAESAVPAQPQPSLKEEFCHLTRDIENTMNCVTILSDRLDPLLVPPSKDDPKTIPGPVLPPMSDYVQMVRDHQRMVRNIMFKVEDIMYRLQE